ncbi:MAG: glutathione S-transferase family protein [Gammaproteobacteria bacterium]|nr:glutathione S-transferase family protein [Gammaproteobacteria bacterium]
MKLYNAWYCPFAQRAWMALVHKGIEFEYVEVDPYDYSDWWLEVSRGAALVPVVVQPNSDGDGETTIVESNRILEYLEDFAPDGNSIFERDPNRRAEQKYWMDHVSNKITPYLYRFLKATEAGDYLDESRDKLVAGLTTLIDAMDSEGPYFSGKEINAVDIALIPFAYRIDVLLGAYRDFELPQTGETWQRYQRWYAAMLDHPSFRKTAFDQDDYEKRLVEHYYPYSQGGGSNHVTQAS